MIQISQQSSGIWVRTADDKPLFFYSTDPRFRTHIHPLNVPGTQYPMSRFRPPDHPWQYGIFCGLNKVNGFDFWCSGDAHYPPGERGLMANRKVINAGPTEEGGGFTAINDWTSPDGSLVLEERQGIGVPDQEADDSYVFDLQWELRASRGNLYIEQSEYGGFSARLVGQPETRRHLNSEGHSGDECAGQAARWVSVAQPVDGVGTYSRADRESFAYAGLAIFDHPQNLCFPNKWRVDGNGMINPAFALSQPVDMAPEEALVFNYRVYVFKGVGQRAVIEAQYRAWEAGLV